MVYVRHTAGISAFNFDNSTGLMTAAWTNFDHTTVSPPFGLERIAVDPLTQNILTTSGTELIVLKPNGEFDASMDFAETEDLTGLCLGPAAQAGGTDGLVAAHGGDLVVAVKGGSTSNYQYTLSYTNAAGPEVVISDIVPRQWVLNDASSLDGMVDVQSKNKGQGPHAIDWTLPAGTTEATFTVNASTAGKGGKNKTNFFEPTHCGALYLDAGALVFDVTAGEVIFASDPLCLAAVKDPVDFTGAGDHDADGISDHDEACGNAVPTDLCEADTDGDGTDDGLDACPLDPLNEC